MQLLLSRDLRYELAPEPALAGDILGMTPFAHRGHRDKQGSLQAEGLSPLTMSFSLKLFQRLG